LGVIQATGEDAAKFLQGQLTNDFSLLDQSHARLSAYCSPKGRMLASFIGFKRPDGSILLVCSRDLLAPVLKRLSMFVMRAKAKLEDASDRFDVYGLLGLATDPSLASAGPWSKSDLAQGSIVNLYPADGVHRQMLVQVAGAPAPKGIELALDTWLWTEVRSAVATLTAPLSELFVPQMLNYESVDGVNFKKGCYPGQEIVARSQFRGTIKRRTYLVQSSAAIAVGTEVFHASDAQQPVGAVVQAALAPSGGCAALICVQVDSTQDGALRAGAADGPDLTLVPLPYSLREDL
jgi:folate-binding protein YgfZ